MPRKPLILTPDHPYHVTNRSNNKEFFYLDLPQLWPIFLEVMSAMKDLYGLEVHAFVLMSNHYHMVVSTPHCNLTEAMTYLHREVARQANKRAKRINHFFGGRYKWCLIHDESYYWNAIKYVLRNPVQAGLCRRVETYPFSSLHPRVLGGSCRLIDPFTPGESWVELDLAWLNEDFVESQRIVIQKALRRREFSPPRDHHSQKTILDTPVLKKGLGT